MGTQVSNDIMIEAPADTVWAVIADLEAYPEWAEGIRSAEVHESDDQGWPLEASFVADARIDTLRYRIAYTWGQDTVSWRLVESDKLSKLDGTYDVSESDGGDTHVAYRLDVDVSLPVPGFLKKRAARHILQSGLDGLKSRAESLA